MSVRLTPETYAHGLAVALPEQVLVPPMRTKGSHEKCGHWRARQELSARMPENTRIPIEGAIVALMAEGARATSRVILDCGRRHSTGLMEPLPT